MLSGGPLAAKSRNTACAVSRSPALRRRKAAARRCSAGNPLSCGPLFQQCGQLPARPAPLQRQFVKISDLSTFLKQCAQMQHGFARPSGLDQGLRQPGTNLGCGPLLEKAAGDHDGQPRLTVVAGDEEQILKTGRIVQSGRSTRAITSSPR